MKYNKSILGIVVAALMAACTEDISNILGNNREIAFELASDSPMRTAAPLFEKEPQKLTTAQGDTFYLHTEVTSRGNVVATDSATMRGAQKTASDLQSDGFVVSAYNTADGTTRGLSYFEFLNTTYNNSKFTPQDAGTKKYWPTGKLIFYAYYPKGSEENGITQGTDASTLTYAVPSTPANHPDLMTAVAANQQYIVGGTGTTPLTFNHALCAVQFQTGNDIAGGTINSVTFNNVYTSGTYHLDNDDWSSQTTGNKVFTLSLTTTEGVSGTPILSENNTLMMIPQDFTDNDAASITINFTISGTPHNLTYKLKDTKWVKGTSIVYSITTDGLVWEYVLEGSDGETAYTGGNVSFNIKSYRYKRTSPSVVEPIAWSINGYKADGASTFSTTKPSWLTSITTSGDGTSTASATNTGTATLAAQTSTTAAASFTDIARGTSTNPYDLSTNGGTAARNTANCYVVNAPGWYKIPLVYGNGIKNGVNNTAAYNSSSFIDYNGTQIRNLPGGPYVNKSGTPNNAVNNAVIVWQDANNLLDNVSYDATSPGYIIFHVGTNMTEGNSLIAIRNSSNVIMWSWHIWVTSLNIDDTFATKTSDDTRTYHAMPVLLGWVNTGNTSVFPKRKVEVQIQQQGTGITSSLTIYQNPYVQAAQTGYATIYQWGRKDPQVPIQRTGTNGYTAINKTIYNGIISSFYATAGPTTLANSIKTPHYYYYDSNYLWQNNTSLYDLWNVGNSSYAERVDAAPHQTIVKSIYDPCPYGYKIPPAKAFTGLTATGDYNPYGVYVKTRFSPSKTVFVPALGIRSYRDDSFTTGEHYSTNVWSTLPIYPASGGTRNGAIGALIACSFSNNGTIGNTNGAAADSWGNNVMPILESDE